MDVLAEYTQRIVGDVKLARPMKVVVDSGNGIPGASAPGILRALGCEVIDLYSTVDGDFPNHHPDPSKPENLADLKTVVRATGAEIGLAFDGDGDRLGVVTAAAATSSTPTARSCCLRATSCRATRAAPSSST